LLSPCYVVCAASYKLPTIITRGNNVYGPDQVRHMSYPSSLPCYIVIAVFIVCVASSKLLVFITRCARPTQVSSGNACVSIMLLLCARLTCLVRELLRLLLPLLLHLFPGKMIPKFTLLTCCVCVAAAAAATAARACVQFPEKMIPKFTLLAARGADLPIHGDGMAVRRCVDNAILCS
jgi:hypothetical protein